MEALREAVYLRSYAQKNPLVEYKLEGFDIFERMIEDIRRMIATRLFLVRIQTPEERQARPVRPVSVASSHDQVGQFGGTATGSSVGGSAVAEASRPEGRPSCAREPKSGGTTPVPAVPARSTSTAMVDDVAELEGNRPCPLRARPGGAKIERVIQPTFDSLSLGLYQEPASLPSSSSRSPRAPAGSTRSPLPPPKPTRPLRFMECLRSRITGGRIESIGQIGRERIVKIEISVPRAIDFRDRRSRLEP